MVSYKCSNDTVTVLLKGEIDHHNAVSLRKEIDEIYQKNDPKSLILDFSEVTFMDSSGIGLVMGRYKNISSNGCKLIIKNPATSIKKVFSISGIKKIAKIVEGEKDGE